LSGDRSSALAVLLRRRSVGTESVIRVAAPGEIALTVTPYFARELAQDQVSPTMPILAAA
jgi:hypothetical protein